MSRPACLLLGLVLVASPPAAAAEAGRVAAPSDAGKQPAAPAPPAAPAAPTTPPLPLLPPPQWVGGADVRGKAQITWIRSPLFATVRVYRRDEGSPGGFRPLADTTASSWLDETVQSGRTYRYRIAGIGADGREGRPSAELAVRIGVVKLRVPAAPEWEGFLALADGVGLKWQAREGEDVIAWNVYRKAPPETEFRLVGSSRGTSFRDTGLEPGRLYIYVLTALDSAFRETPFSRELPVKFTPPQAVPEREKRPDAWRVRRTRLVALVAGGKDMAFERPTDVVVGPVSGSVYVGDSSRNLVFVFSPLGAFQRTVGASESGETPFKNLLGLAADRDENLYVVDGGAGYVQSFSAAGHGGRRVDVPAAAGTPTGLIDAAVGPDGRVYVVDNFNNRVSIVGRGGVQEFGRAGAKPGEFSAPTFCATDAAGSLYVADCLNARVEVFTGSGEFVRAFGRPERGPGGFGRPKGVAVGPGGEIYVADSWLNTIQVFDAEGRFVAILGDEAGRPLDLGSPNGVALGPGNRVYVAERLAARLQIRELLDVP
jgi:hypothetical protein